MTTANTTTTTTKKSAPVAPSAVVMKNGIPSSLPSLDSLFNLTLTSKERESIMKKADKAINKANHELSLEGRMESMVEALRLANPEDARRIDEAAAKMKAAKALGKSRKAIRDLADSKEVLRKATMAYAEESRLANDLLTKAGM